jgi:nucleotide-binding universal stress UspA family protein
VPYPHCPSTLFWKERDHRELFRTDYRLLREARFRLGRLGVRCGERVRVADDPGRAILEELRRQEYQLVVLGALDRGRGARPDLEKALHGVLLRGKVPAVVLVAHEDAG